MAAALERQHALAERIEALGGWDLDHQIRGLAASLGVPPGDRVVDTLSIGERRRVALACAFLSGPDLLALDEPTNHLDTATTEWLEQRLRAFAGAVLLVTHDRWFLERVATRIAEIDRGGLYVYDGGYSRFLEQRAARLGAESEAERQRAAFVRRELDWVRRGPAARSTKQRARLERFDAAVAARPDDVRPDDRQLALRIPSGPRLGGIVVEAEGLALQLGGKRLFAGLDFAMVAGERVGIVGGNGMGKSTLLRVLLGEQAPDAGTVRRGVNTQPLFLDQTRSTLDDRQSVVEAVAAQNDHVFLEDGPVHVRTFLRMMLLDDRVAAARVADLSGGERNRVQLARLLREGGNLLVLDEPTNDLDLMTLSALEEALAAFPGCALVVSHDRWFLDRVATSILAFEGDGRVTKYAGNYSDYLEAREAAAVAASEAAAEAQRAVAAASKPATPAKPAPKPAGLTSPEKRELAGMEAAIEAAEAAVAAATEAVNDPALYTRGAADIAAAQARLSAAEAEVARLYARWEALLARG
jgi:ATP-binding cassette subfamily F protein uup